MKVYPKIYLNKKYVLDALAKRNLTAQDFCKEISCTTAQFHNWCNKKCSVSSKRREQIMLHLNAKWQEIFIN